MCPSLHGLPKVSVIITGTSTPQAFFTSDLINLADLSGSSGSKETILSPIIFEESIPALAHINPCFVSVIKMPLFISALITLRLSLSTSSTNLGSLLDAAEKRSAKY